MKTDAERCREAMAILSECIADSRVPDGLRRLAAAWASEYQSSKRKPQAAVTTTVREGEA